MISFNNVSKHYGGQILYENASFILRPGDKVGLVGPNGAGKTTVFRVLMKEEGFDGGSITVPEKIRVAYFSQNIGEMKGRTVIEEVMSGSAKASELAQKMRVIETKLENDLDPDEMEKVLIELGDYQTEFEKLGGYDLDVRAKEIITGLGVMPYDHDRDVGLFSGGWRMRIALAKVLIQQPDVMLMDEPTNYLDLESIVWLEQWLKDYKGAVLMTSHDRDFMNGIVNRIIEVANKQITTYTGDYDYYEKEKEIRKVQQVAQYESQQAMLQKEEEFIAKFAARASHAAQVQSRVKKIDKIERVELPPEDIVMDFSFPTPPRGSNDVVMMKELAKNWTRDDGTLHKIFSGLTATVNRQDKIAVVGVNGAGKSTLLKVICNLTEASGGECSVGPSIQVGYFSQFSLDLLNPENTVLDEISNRLPHASNGYIRNLLAAFLFRGDDVEKKIKVLSGGEKSRVVLATLMSSNNNLLILDEPTNHLDLKSRDVLLNALKTFDGTVMYVSHDRHFLHGLSNRVFEVDKGGIRVFDTNFQYYVDKKKEEG
ncbi:ABC-F family ATP-binding cassette domain-containing protein [Bacteriovorax sp. PP10]|uniref:ABC-F family ATP-binding cassette domain-containing protein n=1 Tax=Bacteriovorax antarcticus TaxID=3088717 RepID=A0ABU5VS37_9BACT|nr:ABC-F family ATP-binding cassette domain-containing protein [Bacteriovorax sp. PP10]MEA9355867.1 ABC-F family ATP-binding cassette domain-containing protein [Bacteriovorax sp. PP10]